MREHLFVLPTHIEIGKRKIKKIPINLNWYRNAHFQELNNVKKLYKQLIMPQIEQCPGFGETVEVQYWLYPRTRHKQDLDNILGVTKKFFQDALVESAKIQSDDYTVIVKNICMFGHVDRSNPRVEALVRDLGASNLPF
jgi:hypothetical protein